MTATAKKQVAAPKKAAKNKKTSAKKAAAPKTGMTVRSFVEDKLANTSDTYMAIVTAARKKFPGGKTSPSSVRWYASRMRARGDTVREREVSYEAAQ